MKKWNFLSLFHFYENKRKRHSRNLIALLIAHLEHQTCHTTNQFSFLSLLFISFWKKSQKKRWKILFFWKSFRKRNLFHIKKAEKVSFFVLTKYERSEKKIPLEINKFLCIFLYFTFIFKKRFTSAWRN
jgi:hypothetical protein